MFRSTHFVRFQTLGSFLIFSAAFASLLLLHREAKAEAPYVKSKLPDSDQELAERSPKSAVAVINPTTGDTPRGIVHVVKKGNVVGVEGELEGLQPGKHGFHIHTFGDCSAEDASSAGGHFSPNENQHGSPDEKIRHVGDLGNIEADKNGKARIHIRDSQIALSGEHSVIGRSIIVHQNADTFVQPAGDAGTRVACGVIGLGRNRSG